MEGLCGVASRVDLGCIGVFHHAASWVVGFAESLRSGRGTNESEGLILYSGEFDAIRVPIAQVLTCLATGSGRGREIDFWRAALRRFSFMDERDACCHGYPGERLPEGVSFDHAEFKPDPKCLPFADIFAGLKHTARSAGLPVDRLLFEFRGTAIRDAATLLNMLLHRPAAARRARAALDRWRDSTFAAVAERLPRRTEAEGIPFPPELRGNILPRVRLAAILGRVTRTLVRWDRAGRAPAGLPWKPGVPLSGNLVVYDLESNWPTLTALLTRVRDPKRDRLWLAELGRASLAASDCRGTVLDELIAEDERGGQS